jgi:DNA primase
MPVHQWAPEPEQGLEMPSDADWIPPDFSPEGEEGWDAYPSSASEGGLRSPISLYELPKKQRQLLDFVLLYPEFLSELLAGGLKESLGQSPIMGLVDAMEQLGSAGNFTPEHLLSVVASGSERQYIADLLSKDGEGHLDDESEEQGRVLCDELLIYLKRMQQQREGVDLQKRIVEAEQVGNYSLVSELQRKKMLALQGKTRNGNRT